MARRIGTERCRSAAKGSQMKLMVHILLALLRDVVCTDMMAVFVEGESVRTDDVIRRIVGGAT